VQQLVSNLVGNALNYGLPTEPVAIDVVVDDGWLSISVKNGGEPISPGNLDKIFEPYWRPATSKPGGGLGLGLHICSQIVRAHGGSLQVTSSAENGTCFVARLPACPGSSATA
ncbi:MAG: histidine kinase, partial [Variovorax sp.]|nr:histidine kinase [Variovorax sp.]